MRVRHPSEFCAQELELDSVRVHHGDEHCERDPRYNTTERSPWREQSDRDTMTEITALTKVNNRDYTEERGRGVGEESKVVAEILLR